MVQGTNATAVSESPSNKKTRTKGVQRKKNGRAAAGQRRSRSKGPEVRSVFLREVQEILDGESQLARFLPKLERETRSDALRDCTLWMQQESERYCRNLGRVLREHRGGKARRSPAMRGMIEEAKKGVRLPSAPERDLVTITNLQKIVHYSIASYGSLRAWSRLVDDDDAELLFDRMADERGRADRILTRIAEDLYAGHHSGNGAERSRARSAG